MTEGVNESSVAAMLLDYVYPVPQGRHGKFNPGCGRASSRIYRTVPLIWITPSVGLQATFRLEDRFKDVGRGSVCEP